MTDEQVLRDNLSKIIEALNQIIETNRLILEAVDKGPPNRG